MFQSSNAIPQHRHVGTSAHQHNYSRARLGMLFFLAAETMMFAGLISAFVVLKAALDEWPPTNQPRFPLAVSIINMITLFASAAAARAGGEIKAKARSLRWHKIAVVLGAMFLAIQGLEWWHLMRFGMSTVGNIYTGSFYAVIGTHALHVAAGLIALAWAIRSSAVSASADATRLAVARIYWYFVVGVWPALYVTVYL